MKFTVFGANGAIGEIIEADDLDALATRYPPGLVSQLQEIPGDAAFDWMNHPDDGVISPSQAATYFIDERGRKFIADGDGRQELVCAFNATLDGGPGSWAAVDPLVALKRDIKTGIDAAAERERLKYVTAGAGQAMTYQEKAAELLRYQADGDPQAGDYPMLASEIGITGATLADVAAAVAAARAQWTQIGAAIEAVRMAAKAAVDAAQDEVEARAVTVTWPQP